MFTSKYLQLRIHKSSLWLEVFERIVSDVVNLCFHVDGSPNRRTDFFFCEIPCYVWTRPYLFFHLTTAVSSMCNKQWKLTHGRFLLNLKKLLLNIILANFFLIKSSLYIHKHYYVFFSVVRLFSGRQIIQIHSYLQYCLKSTPVPAEQCWIGQTVATWVLLSHYLTL